MPATARPLQRILGSVLTPAQREALLADPATDPTLWVRLARDLIAEEVAGATWASTSVLHSPRMDDPAVLDALWPDLLALKSPRITFNNALLDLAHKAKLGPARLKSLLDGLPAPFLLRVVGNLLGQQAEQPAGEHRYPQEWLRAVAGEAMRKESQIRHYQTPSIRQRREREARLRAAAHALGASMPYLLPEAMAVLEQDGPLPGHLFRGSIESRLVSHPLLEPLALLLLRQNRALTPDDVPNPSLFRVRNPADLQRPVEKGCALPLVAGLERQRNNPALLMWLGQGALFAVNAPPAVIVAANWAVQPARGPMLDALLDETPLLLQAHVELARLTRRYEGRRSNPAGLTPGGVALNFLTRDLPRILRKRGIPS
jgi:hypothetical protein